MADANVIYDIFLPDCAASQHPDYLCEEHSSSWGKGADVTLSDDSTIYKSRTASLKAVSTGTNDVYYYPSAKDLAADMTGAECICFWYYSSVTNAFRISIHTDGSNYKYKDVTPAAINTWYFTIIKLADMTETGTLNLADVDYIQFDHKNANRTMYVDLYAVGKLYEIANITDIDFDWETNVEVAPGWFRVGDFLMSYGIHSSKYMVTFVVADKTKTEQQLLDELNILEYEWRIRREGMIYHSEPSGQKRTMFRGCAIWPMGIGSGWTQSRVRDYPVTFRFMSYDNADME